MANEGEQLYFVSIEVKWGKQNGDEQFAESTGGQNWGYLTYDQAIGLETAAVIPNLNQMMSDAGDIGLEGSESADVVRAALDAKVKDKVK